MEWSKYNFLYFSDKYQKYLLYNTLSNSFIDVSEPTLLELLQNLQNTNNIISIEGHPELFKELKKSRILVESDETEILKIRHRVLTNRYSTNVVVLTLLPTLACNFKCPYCFAGKKRTVMKPEVFEKIIRLVQNVSMNNKHTLVNLTWMGGEPLLNFDVIKTLSHMLLDLGIELNASIVTNGYLLTKEVIEQLPDLKIKRVQVTIDGLYEEHNNTRIHKNDKNSFQKIINNLDVFFSIYNKHSDPAVNIRVNLARESNYVEKFIQVNYFIRQRYRNENLYISPGFIEDIKMNGKNRTCEFDKAALKDFYRDLVNAGLLNYSMYPRNYSYECATRSENSFVIGPLGELYSCWENIGHENSIVGKLRKDGFPDISDETAFMRYLTDADYITEEECLQCRFLPICTGGCPEKRIRNKHCNGEFDVCALYKDNVEEMLDLHYSTKFFD
jgi:uncharacterized protein